MPGERTANGLTLIVVTLLMLAELCASGESAESQTAGGTGNTALRAAWQTDAPASNAPPPSKPTTVSDRRASSQRPQRAPRPSLRR